LRVQVRRNTFKEQHHLEGNTDVTGYYDSIKKGPDGVFDRLALVLLGDPSRPRGRIPVPLVDDQPVLVSLAESTDDYAGVFSSRLSIWKREVAESYQVQWALFKEIE